MSFLLQAADAKGLWLGHISPCVLCRIVAVGVVGQEGHLCPETIYKLNLHLQQDQWGEAREQASHLYPLPPGRLVPHWLNRITAQATLCQALGIGPKS